LIGGSIGALVVFGFLFWRKKVVELDPFVANVEAAAAGSAVARSTMAARARELTRNLDALGQTKTEEIANRVAEQYMADQYGITPARVESLKRIASAFGM
jgi:hypothetical protein